MTTNCASSDTQDLISLYYQTFNRGDRPAFLRLLHPDVLHEINQGGSESGIEAFRIFLERMDRCYAEQVEDLVVFTSETPNRVAAEFFIRGKYVATDDGLPAANGQTYHLRIGAFFELCDGKIKRITNYYNLSEWLRMVGA